MQHLSFGIFKRKGDPQYEKAMDALSELYAESKIEVPSLKTELSSLDAIKSKFKLEFKQNIRLDEHKKYLTDAISILISEGERYLKQNEWDTLLSELRNAKKKLEKLTYEVPVAEIYYQSLNITDAGMRAIDTIARLKYRHKEYEGAIALHILLSTLNAAEPLYWYHLGICFQDAGFYDKAAKTYICCHILDPKNIASRIFSAECYLELKDKNKAREQFDEATVLVEVLAEKSPWDKHLKFIKKRIEHR
jgi:tetratricopeptide (TPR) repeat protein